MNIGFIEPFYPSKVSGGGAGTYVQLVARELVRRGHKAVVFAAYVPGEGREYYVDEGVHVYRLKNTSLHYFVGRIPVLGNIFAKAVRSLEYSGIFLKKLKEVQKEHSIDIIEHVETGNILFAISNYVPFVMKLHGSNYTVKKFFGEKITIGDVLERFLERIVIKKAIAVTSPSAFLAHEVFKECGLKKTPLIQPSPVDPECLKSSINTPNEQDPVVLYAGRFEKRKGVHVLMEAATKVIAQYPNVTFRFFGSDTSDMNKEEMLSYFSRHQIADKVQIFGHIPKENLLRQYQKASIVVLPSAYDTSPLVIYEAMGCGKSVVATNVGGIPELIDDQLTGLLVPYGDVRALTDAILKLLLNEQLRKEMGLRGREKAKEKYSLEKIVTNQIDFYKQALRKWEISKGKNISSISLSQAYLMQIIGFEIYGPEKQHTKILDMGCGQGWAVLEAAKQGAKAFGLDISRELLDKTIEHTAKENFLQVPVFLMGRSERAPFFDNIFDVIICTEVIEHTLETDLILSEIKRLLKPGGKCLFSFPVKYVEKIIASFHKGFLAYSGHVKQFSLEEMKCWLKRHDLEVLKVEKRYFEWSLYWFWMAVFGMIPDHDRRGDRYGVESDQEKKWEKFSYYYKRIWARLVEWKIGIPLLWFGNQLFPKSYFLIIRKPGRLNSGGEN